MAFYCRGKKGICDELRCPSECPHCDGSGGYELYTNSDYIRGMTDEELAKWLCFRFECYGEEDPCPAKDYCKPGGQNGMLDWLQQPYEGKENDL